jgi:hypothetical protein
MQTATAAAMQDAPVGREEAFRAACLGVLDHYLEGAGIEPARRRFLRDHFLLDVEQVARLPMTEAGGGSALEGGLLPPGGQLARFGHRRPLSQR